MTKKSNFVSDSYFAQEKQSSHFVSIPNLRQDNSRIKPSQVGVFTLPDKVGTPLHRTIPELSGFLLYTEHVYTYCLKSLLKLKIGCNNNYFVSR